MDTVKTVSDIAIKNEAVKRLTYLGADKELIIDPLNNIGTVFYSERINRHIDALLYFISNRPAWVEKIKELEEEYNIYVYHGILNHMEFGDILSLLYVSRNDSYWKRDWEDLKDGIENVLAFNVTDSDKESSQVYEFSRMQITSSANMGGLKTVM